MQLYNKHIESLEDLELVVQAIENFSEKRFLSALHTKSSFSMDAVISLDSDVLSAIACLQRQHADLQTFAKDFNRQFVTRNNHYFNSAHQLLRKIHTAATEFKHLFARFTPNSSAAAPRSTHATYVQPSIYERSPLATEAYTPSMFDLSTYPLEVQNLFRDMSRFFTLLRDSLLLCIDVIREEMYIRRDAQQCRDLYHLFKDDYYLRIKRHLNSIRIDTPEFDAANSPAIALRMSARSEEDFSQKGFHALDIDDVCTLVTKEMVEDANRAGYDEQELLLFRGDKQFIARIRYIISHFDDYIPATHKRKNVPATLVACLMAWANPAEDLGFVKYFRATYTNANGQFQPPSNPAVNQAKRPYWERDPFFCDLIEQWKNVQIA